jgi:vacuolar protein sorting-associated protein 13A/C
MSDTKYKSLMRLIDVCVPNLDDNDATPTTTVAAGDNSGGFKLSPLFAQPDAEYSIVDDSYEGDDKEPGKIDRFYEAEDGNTNVCLCSSSMAIADIIPQ